MICNLIPCVGLVLLFLTLFQARDICIHYDSAGPE
jgi:hypothetical protein